MINNEKHVSANNGVLLLLIFLNTIILRIGFTQNENMYMALVITLPLMLVAIYDAKRKKPAAQRN